MNEAKKAEDEVLDFWKKNKIYGKSREKNKKGKKYYFMDGPPYATGHIHMGTALNKIMKDIAMRYRRIQGYDVFDRPGYDSHGLPIEWQVEKLIGSKSKKDIENYGVKRFVDECKKFATKHIDSMNEDFANLGVWMDWDNPYVSLEDEYIEAVWDVLKKASDKKLLYLGKYPVNLCPRCETAVAYNEIEYAKMKDASVFVKFPLRDKKDTYLIIWTTTPWTLPANAGIMVHPAFDYAELEVENDEKWIISKERVATVMALADKKYKIIKEFKGKSMEGWKYENPLARHTKIKIEKGNRVVMSGRYVTNDEGSGLVHCAPGHGKEDYEVGKQYGLDSPSPVGMDGRLTHEAGKYAGKKALEANTEIIADLEEEGFLAAKQKYEHDYPVCWRCKSQLLLVSHPQWFLRISEIHNKILRENEENKWVPDYMKLRMKAWLEGISDWPISRERYWGTPLPIWECQKCDEKKVIGSIAELQKLSGVKKIGLHKPEVDEIEIKCSCEGMMRRIAAVLDVWFDSGVSSWAALGYPSDKKKFERYWPADLNIEGKDQFRGWWNSQIILSVIGFDRRPFEKIAVHGMVLDVERKKMSKSLGNVVSPNDVIEKFGRDYMRYYFAKLSKGEDFAYDEREFKEIANFFRVLTNINTFVNQIDKGEQKMSAEDYWITSRFNSTLMEVEKSFDACKYYEAVIKMEEFLVKDLSRTYIQMIRDRASEVRDLMNEIRTGFIKMLSPIAPFVTESIWQELRKQKIVKEESIHLSDMPKYDKDSIDKKLEEEFVKTFRIIEAGLAERDRAKVGLRWPLAKISVISDFEIPDSLKEIIKNQLNVKEVDMNEGKEFSVSLDLKMTLELEAEGFAREIARKVQAERKNRGLTKKDSISLRISTDKNLAVILKGQTAFLKERTGSKKVEFTDDKSKEEMVEFLVKDRKIKINF